MDTLATHDLSALEAVLAQREAELQAARQELDNLIYAIAHDVRAPLRAIDGFGQMLQEDYAHLLDDQGQDYLQRVRSTTQHMEHMIASLLHLSALTQAPLRYEPVNLSTLAETICSQLHKRDPQRRVEWSIAHGVVAEGDPGMLRLALYHLLENAWKFTYAQPAARIVFGQSADYGVTAYFVRDNGLGFTLSSAHRLFVPFQRLHARHECEGIGLGLTMVQRIVHRHGGRVWAEGVKDQGATFYFTLQYLCNDGAPGCPTALG